MYKKHMAKEDVEVVRPYTDRCLRLCVGERWSWRWACEGDRSVVKEGELSLVFSDNKSSYFSINRYISLL